jgi:hypothetical protein
MSDRITLNVGGRLFITAKDILNKAEYFKSLLNRWNNEDEIFIDRSPHIFKHVLSLLRNSNYKYPEKYLDELEFYGIDFTSDVSSFELEEILNEHAQRISELEESINYKEKLCSSCEDGLWRM